MIPILTRIWSSAPRLPSTSPESGGVPPSPLTRPATARATHTAPAVVPTRRPSGAGPGAAASDLAGPSRNLFGNLCDWAGDFLISKCSNHLKTTYEGRVDHHLAQYMFWNQPMARDIGWLDSHSLTRLPVQVCVTSRNGEAWKSGRNWPRCDYITSIWQPNKGNKWCKIRSRKDVSYVSYSGRLCLNHQFKFVSICSCAALQLTKVGIHHVCQAQHTLCILQIHVGNTTASSLSSTNGKDHREICDRVLRFFHHCILHGHGSHGTRNLSAAPRTWIWTELISPQTQKSPNKAQQNSKCLDFIRRQWSSSLFWLQGLLTR